LTERSIRNHASLELEVAHARHLALEPRTLAEAALSTWLARLASERGNLQRGVLAIRRDAGIADFHAAIFGLNYRTRKPLFSWAF
jgi:hypothetical protein